MLAYSQLEPWGPLQEDYRAGTIAAAVWNVAIDHRKSQPVKPADFMPALDPERRSANEPILLNDPKAQAALIRAQVFGPMERANSKG